MNFNNVIVESDSQVTILSTRGEIAPNKISNLIDDLRSIFRKIKNVTFFFILIDQLIL